MMALAPFDRRGRYRARVRTPPLPFLQGQRDPLGYSFQPHLGGVGLGGLRRGAIHPPCRSDLLRDPGLFSLQTHPLNRRAHGGQRHDSPHSSALGLLGQYPLLHRYGQLDADRDRDLQRYRNCCDCDACYRKSLLMSNSCHNEVDQPCLCGDRNCNINQYYYSSNSNKPSSLGAPQKLDFKTKDITIRGKARPVRASYLTEAPKFEAELLKYLDKKKEDLVPDRVIDMLIDFINRDDYINTSHVDEITLNILAFNVGAKSVVDHSLARLRKHDYEVRSDELSCIVGTVMMSLKVDSGLKDWLKKYLQNDNRLYRLEASVHWQHMTSERPELYNETMRLLGYMPEAGDEGFKTL